MPSGDATTSLSQYLSPLRQNRKVILLVTVVTVALGLVVALAGPRSYSASTSVLIYPVSADPTEALQATDRSDDMATELRIAESRAVAEITATELRSLGVEVSPSNAAANIVVANPDDSRVLNVSYRSSDPAVARVGSDVATSAYLAYRSELNAASRQVARSSINDEIGVLQDRLTDVENRIEATAAGSSARLIVEVEKTSIEGELEAQQRALADLSVLAIDAATVFDNAQQPTSPDGLGLAQLLVGALAGGLVLGVIAAWALAGLGIDLETRRSNEADQSKSDEKTADTDKPEKRERASRRLRRSSRNDEDDDADNPFDDTDNRDPLELLKALDAIEADPRIALATASSEREAAAAAAEAEATAESEKDDEAAPSFAEMYPNGFLDTDGEAGDLIDALGAAEQDDDSPANDADEFSSLIEDETVAEPGSETGSVPEPDSPSLPPAALRGLPGLDSLPPVPVPIPTGVGDDDGDEARDPFSVDALSDDAFPDSAFPDDAFPDGALSDHAPSDDPFSVDALADEPLAGHTSPDDAFSDHAFSDHTSSDHASPDDAFSDHASSDHASLDDAVSDDAAVAEHGPDGADDVATFTEYSELVDQADGDGDGAGDGDDAEASLTTGDPNEHDPGPPSWDGPFVGPTTWDQLTAMAAAAADGHPEGFDASGDPAWTPGHGGEADLVAGNDMDSLFERLGQLGSTGPVAVLSLSDRFPAAGLTAGFELADELRAVGADTLLIDARIESPVLDTLFEGEPGAGLAQVMTGEVVLGQAVRNLSGLDGLDLLTVGVVGSETHEHLTGSGFQRLLSEARLNYHSIVIISDAITPADPDDVIDVERARALAATVDGIIVGTADPAGTVASDELVALLASFDAPTLQLIAAPVAVADQAANEASSV